MSAAASSTLQNFMVFAPDYADEGALERRLKVRQQHMVGAQGQHAEGFMKLGGALLGPETPEMKDATSRMIGSMFVVRAQSVAEVKEKVESDIYWTSGVWDKERLLVMPFLPAPFFKFNEQ